MRAELLAIGVTLAACGAAAPTPVRNANERAIDGYIEAVNALRVVQQHREQIAAIAAHAVTQRGFGRWFDAISNDAIDAMLVQIAAIAPTALGRTVVASNREPERTRDEHLEAVQRELARALAAVRDHTPGAAIGPASPKVAILDTLSEWARHGAVHPGDPGPDYLAADYQLYAAGSFVGNAIAAHELRDDAARRELDAANQENIRNGGEESLSSRDYSLNRYTVDGQPPRPSTKDAAEHLRELIEILAKPEPDPAMARTRDETLAHVTAALRIVDPSATDRPARTR